MIEAFALQKLLTFFQQKYWRISDINVWKFNEALINDIVSFEQPGPDLQLDVLSKIQQNHTKQTKASLIVGTRKQWSNRMI